VELHANAELYVNVELYGAATSNGRILLLRDIVCQSWPFLVETEKQLFFCFKLAQPNA
jgi:hypothetical protein